MTTMTNEQDLEEIKLITMINLLLNQLSKQLNVAEGSERISFDESNFFQNKDIVNELVTSKLFTANLLDKQKIIDTFTNALDQIQAHIRITSSIRPSPAISKMRDLMNMWEKLLSNPDIAEDISEVVINRYVRSLLTAGRIYSDQYRATSDIAYHLHAMQYEIEAMRAAVYGLPDTKQYRTTRVKTLINCAISAYRIKLYSIAIPLADIAYIYASNKKRGVISILPNTGQYCVTGPLFHTVLVWINIYPACPTFLTRPALTNISALPLNKPRKAKIFSKTKHGTQISALPPANCSRPNILLVHRNRRYY